jgi:hypothetical protein
MEIDPQYFEERKAKAELLYASRRTIHNPYLDCEVVLNSDGFHHLQFSARTERSKKAQLLKFSLLPLALETIRRAGTLQEYRKILQPIGRASAHSGTVMKQVEYWGFVAILGRQEAPVKLRTVLRRVGDGNVIFWSVMPDTKFKKGKQRLSTEGIEDN